MKSGWMHRLLCHLSSPWCSSVFPLSSVSLHVTHAPQCFIHVHGDMPVSHRGEQARASPPAAPGPLNQAGLAWLGLIGGQSMRGICLEEQLGAMLSQWKTLKARRNGKQTGTEQQSRTFHKLSQTNDSQVCFELSKKGEYYKQMADSKQRLNDCILLYPSKWTSKLFFSSKLVKYTVGRQWQHMLMQYECQHEIFSRT